MGNSSSVEDGSGLASPNILSKVTVKGSKADMDAFLTEGRVNNVQIAYVTKKQHERFNPRNINRRVELTHAMLKGVKRNWAMISEGPETQGSFNGASTSLVALYDTFFARLFLLEPSMRSMFGDNMIRQSKFLVGLVNIIVKMEDMLKQGLSPLYSFADRSVAMGARPEHYEVIAEVLPIALEACAGEGVWTPDIAGAWRDVMSFAILAVVERTVESWGSTHGTSLSEMWHALSDWRSRTSKYKFLSPTASSSSPMNADSGGRGRKGSNDRGKGSKATSSSAFSTASSLGSNGSGRPPEAPPPLGRRDLDDGAHHLNHKKGLGSLSFKRKGSGGASNSSLSAANVPSMDLDSGFLSDGEADVLSPDHRSPAGVSVDASGGRRKSGGLKGGPRDDLSSSSQDGKISSGSVGGGSGDVGASFVQSMDSLGLPPDSSSSPASSSGVAVGAAAHPLRGLRAIGDHSRRSSDNSSAGSAADQRQWTPSVGRRAPASAGAGSDGSMSSSSIASASAVPGHRANGSSRSSFTLLRKKLTRSASLESEDSRLRGTEFGGPVGYRGRSGGSGDGLIGGGSGSGSGGGVRGRGRDGSAALGTVYVRSRSVLDEALPTTDQQQAALELSNDFDQHVDVLADGHPRRKGLVSRMRRTASNVIRHPFRSSSSNSGGVSRPGAADLTGSGGAHNAPFGSGDGGGRQGQRGGGARGGGGGSAGGMGVVPALSISSASPGSVSTAVPTPSAATPASDRDQGSRGDHGNARTSGAAGAAGGGGGFKDDVNVAAAGDGGGGDSFCFSNQDKKRQNREKAQQQQQQRKQGRGSSAAAGQHGDSSGAGGRGGGGRGGGGERGRVNPWRQMKLHELMAKLEDSTAEETEASFGNIGEAILFHLKPSEPPTTRALALDVAQTFVQNVLSERSKDKRSSKIRRRAFKELLAHLIPLMLDCLKSPEGSSSSSSPRDENASLGNNSSLGGAGGQGRGEEFGDGGEGAAGGLAAGKGLGGEVIVLHYYQQHHQYLLKVAVLETMNRFLTVLRALFRPPQSTRVQKVVAPLLDASEEVLREKAAAVLGKLSLCGRDTLKWANIAIKVSLESHNLLQDAWPDEIVGQVPSAQVETIMGEHPLLPPIQDTFNKGDVEAYVLSIGRRFPALCKLLATLVTASPPKSQEPEEGDGQQQQQQQEEEGKGKESDGSSNSAPFQIPFLVSLSISLVQRVLRMGEQAWAKLEEERAGVKRDDPSPTRRRASATTAQESATSTNTSTADGTLSPELAARVSGLLLPSAVTLLEALVASSRLEKAMEDRQGTVCQCMGQAVAQTPVQGGVRFAAYRAMAVIIRYIRPDTAAEGLGVPILPLLFNEALLALGNRVNLHALNTTTKTDVGPRSRNSEKGGGSPKPLLFNVRNPLNNGHGAKLHEDTVWAGVECLATFILDCGLFLPAAQVAEVESVVTEGVELLAHRPLEVSPFNEDEPQVLRHASTREAFVRLVHYYLLLAEEKKRNPGSNLYTEAKLAFHCHLQDPDGAVARECRVALTALKTDRVDHRTKENEKALEDMEAEADQNMHNSGTGEVGYTLEELENGEYHVVRRVSKSPRKKVGWLPSPH